MQYDKVICPVCHDKTTVNIPDSAKEVTDVGEYEGGSIGGGDPLHAKNVDAAEVCNKQKCEECYNEIVVGWVLESDGGILF
jgi:hypothetical protein